MMHGPINIRIIFNLNVDGHDVFVT
jgi:hypothetical protein